MRHLIRWVPFELHTHTNHSDGSHTLDVLVDNAIKLGYEGIALTDHSTMSGLAEAELLQNSTGLHIIGGMEWTTFFGHVLFLGIKEYVDWRDLGIGDLHKRLSTVHAQGAVIGAAHPFRVGSPMCTGCYWNYEVQDWSEIDYIEVWSGTFPSVHKVNLRAFQLWTDLLDQGYRISAVSGRDWHSPEPVSEPLAATFLAIDEDGGTEVAEMAVKALGAGLISVSMGPLLLLRILSLKRQKQWHIGEIIPNSGSHEKLEVKIYLDRTARAGYWVLEDEPLSIVVNSNLGSLTKIVLHTGNTNASFTMEATGLKWIRAEMYGVLHGADTMIAFTNPVYFE